MDKASALAIAGILAALAGVGMILVGEPSIEVTPRPQAIKYLDITTTPPGDYEHTQVPTLDTALLHLDPTRTEARAELTLDHTVIEREECRGNPIRLALVAEGVYKNQGEPQGPLELRFRLTLTPQPQDGAGQGAPLTLEDSLVIQPPPQEPTPRYTVELPSFRAHALVMPTLEYGRGGRVVDAYTMFNVDPRTRDPPTLPPGVYRGVFEATTNATGLALRARVEATVLCTYVERVTETQTQLNLRTQTLYIPEPMGVRVPLAKLGLALALLGNLLVALSLYYRRCPPGCAARANGGPSGACGEQCETDNTLHDPISRASGCYGAWEESIESGLRDNRGDTAEPNND